MLKVSVSASVAQTTDEQVRRALTDHNTKFSGGTIAPSTAMTG